MSRGYSARENNVKNNSTKESSTKELYKLRRETHSKELKLRKEVAKKVVERAQWLHETKERWAAFVLGKEMTEAEKSTLNKLNYEKEQLDKEHNKAAIEYGKADARYQLSLLTPEEMKRFGYFYKDTITRNS
jgi:hypothetical protein